MIIPKELVDNLRSKKVILFTGAGVSMNLGLPSWSRLIAHMANDLGFEAEEFEKKGNFLELAEYYQLEKGSLSSLVEWMDANFHHDDIKVENCNIFKQIVELNFKQIYTTNYDNWIEKAYEYYNKPYDKITGIYDFTKTEPENTHVIKYHGDFVDHESIVLTETSYFERLGLDTPLDMKLRSDSLGKSLLFIGYSLSDLDIRLLLFKLHRLWDDHLEDHQQPKSYILLTRDNPIQIEVLKSRNVIPIISDESHPGKALENFLSKLIEYSV